MSTAVAATTPCLVGFWGHLFGNGKRETNCRIRFDLTTNKLTDLEVEERGKFYPATECQRADVEDSILNANEEAIDNPEDFGLVRVACAGPADWPQTTNDGTFRVRPSLSHA